MMYAARTGTHGQTSVGWAPKGVTLPALAIVLWAVVQASGAEVPFQQVVLDDSYIAYERDVGDIDGDGRNDVAAVMEGDTTVQIFHAPAWKRSTLVTFTGEHRYPRADDFKLADIDGDGDPDVVTRLGKGPSDDGPGVAVWCENRDGGSRFVPHVIGNSLEYVKDIVVADFDRDGRLDVAMRMDSRTQLWLQEPGGTWTEVLLPHPAHEGMEAGDLDMDGDPDLVLNGYWFETPDTPAAARVAANYAYHVIDPAWFNQTGDWTKNSCKVVVADFDGDGRNDVAFSHSERPGHAVAWYGSATPRVDGAWTKHPVAVVDFCHTLQAADFDLDGDVDLLAGGMIQSQHRGLRLMLNRDRGAGWTESIIQTDGSYSAEVGDIDNDGDPDIVGIRNWNSPPTWIYRNNSAPQRTTRGVAASRDTLEARPNIVLLLADDLGYGDLGCYGGTAATPHLDRLAGEGVRFTSFYSNGPECSPTRAALLTGRYQQRVGGLECAIGTGNVGRYDDAIRLCAQHDLGLPVSEVSLARRLKDAGYATAIVGKWHLGYEEKFSPNAHGFDHAFYCLGGGMDYFHHVEDPPTYLPVLRLDGEPIQRPGYITDLIAEDAVRWLRARRDRPFFLYVPFTAPHSPYQGPADGSPTPLPADSSRWKQGTADPNVYAAMIERMDWAVGRILDTLNELDATRNTLVIFASDNGGTRSARQGGLHGYKGSTFEGGIRVPCIVRWPGVLPTNQTTDQAAVTMDLTASMVHAAGAPAPTDHPFDGIDVLKHLQTGDAPVSRTLFWRARRGDNTWWAVRDGDLKYVARRNAKTQEEHLFDLDQDLGETTDLLDTCRAEVTRLKRLLAAWEKQMQPSR